MWGVKVKLRVLGFWIREGKRKRPEFSVRSANLPFVLAPINDTGRILARQQCSRGKMRIVESDIRRRDQVALSLNIHISRRRVPDGEHPRGLVEGISLLLKILATGNGLASYGYGVRRESHTQYIGRFIIEG